MGQFFHTVDDKGRLTIPSKLREELGTNFVLTRGLDNCLAVYPKAEWENIIKKYKELPPTTDVRNFMRIFLSGAVTCDFDKLGRINIPSLLLDFAKLKKDCIIVGVNDRAEIWASEVWNEFIKQNETNMSDIADSLFMQN
jgi:MraZ protein